MKYLLLVSILIASSLGLRAQPYDSGRVYILHPRPMQSYSFHYTLGASITFVPRPIAEEEIRQIPTFDAHLRYDVPYGFMLQGHIGSNYITNLLSIGAGWSYSYGRLSVSLGDNPTLWYGFANLDGFDVDATGWMNIPYASIGIMTDELLITLRGEAQFITARTTRVGEVESASDKNRLAGYSIGLFLEQPFYHQRHVMLGIKINNLSSAYQSWLAFATFTDSLIYPEFSMGFIL